MQKLKSLLFKTQISKVFSVKPDVGQNIGQFSEAGLLE